MAGDAKDLPWNSVTLMNEIMSQDALRPLYMLTKGVRVEAHWTVDGKPYALACILKGNKEDDEITLKGLSHSVHQSIVFNDEIAGDA